MTELELFPRGKGTSTASSSQDSRTVSSSSNRARGSHGSDGREESATSRKRKAPGAVPGQKADDRDWLFGAPKAASKTRAPLKETKSSKNEAASEIHRKVSSGTTLEESSSIVEERHGRSSRLTSVSSKSLVKGTLVLGVIFKVKRFHVLVSLPAGSTGVVRKSEVSDFFYAKAAAQHRESYPEAPSDLPLYGKQLDEVLSMDCELSDIFHVGQVLRCGILLTKEPDRRRFDLTLRASLINRGLSLSQLKDGCGIYGCIISAEDHGFVASLGLDGVTAFVPLSQAPKQGFKIGQPVEAVVTKVKAAARTVTLSTDPGMVASALSTGSGFDLRSIKPGMLVETELDKVLPNGITVTFLDYFSGCVDHDNMPVVSTDCKDDPKGWRGLVKSEPKNKARVLMVNYALKAIRLTMRPHLLALERPSGLPSLRSLVKAKVLRIDQSRGLLLKVMGSDDVKISGNGLALPRNGLITSGGEKTREESSNHEHSRTEVLENGDGPGASIETGAGSPVIGAYVHVTKIGEAGVKTENLRKQFTRGKEVLCRVLQEVTVEGRISASLRPSHLLTSATRYEDLCVGKVIEGEMMSVNEVGIVVRLGQGLRALVRNNDIGEVRVNNPSSRFKLGARVKGRVLKVNLQRRRAFLTLKKSMVEDERLPLKKYHKATTGRRCLGMVIKVGSFGLHVAFYNGVVGLVPTRRLKKHGVDNPSEAFRVGQTTACRVLKCNWMKRPVKLLLGLDVPGEEEEEEKAALKAKKKEKTARAEIGDMVRGVVSKEQKPQRAIAVDLYPLPPSPSGVEGQGASQGDETETSQGRATKPKRGYLMVEHVGDNVSTCRRVLPSALKPGTELSRLLVFGTSRTGAPLVTMKPLLLFAASNRTSRKRPRSTGMTEDSVSIPSRVADVSPGDVVAGYVSSIKEFGVFVSFFGGFTALCPRSFLVDERLQSPEKRFTLGDSVRCVVRRVNPDSGLVSVDMRRSQVPSSSLLYTRSFLWETFTTKAVANAKEMSKGRGASEKGQRKPLWAQFELGMNLKAKVVARREDGVVLETGEEGEEQRMLCPPEHVPDATLEEGDEVEVRVLGVDADTGMLDVTMDSDLVQAGQGGEDPSTVEVGSTVSANVILAKPRSKFAVAAISGSLFIVEVAEFNCSARTNAESGFSTSLPGEVITARVGDTVMTEAEGFWEAQRDGPLGYLCCNPYAGARILVPIIEEPMSTGRKSGGAAADEAKWVEEHVPQRKKRRVEEHKSMKTGKIPLKEIVPGAEVTCQVSSVLPDCLSVKVAVKFARRDPISTGRSEDDGDVEGGDDAREPRVRARIHCAWAGKPVVDAPSVTLAKEIGAKDATDAEPEMQLPVWHPLRKYREGQILKARVLLSEDKPSKNRETRSIRLFELGLIKVCDSDETASEGLSPKLEALPWWGRRAPKRREVYRGVVMKTGERGVKVSLSSSVDGFLPWKFVEETLDDPRHLFKSGMGVRVQVFHVDEAERRVILTRQGLPSCEVLPDSELPALAPKRVATAANTGVNLKRGEDRTTIPKKHGVGDIAKGIVSIDLKAVIPPCLMVRLDSGQIGRVCITELVDEDSWEDSPLSKFEDGREVTCRVLRYSRRRESAEAVPSKHRLLELSLRPSRVNSSGDAEVSLAMKGAPETDSVVKAYVEETTKVGCFVRLSGGTRARVLLKDLHDRFLPNPGEVFPTGKLVVGKVLAQDAGGHVSLTLKPSKVAGSVDKKLKWSSSDLKPGLKIKGNVSSVQAYGAFIDIDDSEIRGMAHRSKAADHFIEDMTTAYEVGDRVKAVVLKVEKKSKRLSLGLKPSYFEGDPDTSSEEDGDSEVEDRPYSMKKKTGETETSGVGTNPTRLKDVGGGNDDEREEENRESSRGVLLDMSDGGASNAFGLDFGHFGSRVDSKDETESEDDEDSDEDDEDVAGGAGHRSRKKARERREEEERTVAKEKALLDEDAAPETDEDFERMVIASPNDSLTWVQYMAFKLSLADIDGARSVAERALKTISFRREQERFNVWVSLLNLEHKFGSSKSLRNVMERACQNTNPKKVNLHMAQIHAKAKEFEESDEVYESAVKKFRQSKKVWMAYQLSRLERGDATGAREVLQRSLQSLAKHKHVVVISRFAQNEFEFGSVERGRTIFEGLMASYPKRLDLWNVYVDKEIKAGKLDAARNLLERMTGMEFNAKRMKGVFKKYLQFETAHGDEAGVEAVKAKAMEYVASVAG